MTTIQKIPICITPLPPPLTINTREFTTYKSLFCAKTSIVDKGETINNSLHNRARAQRSLPPVEPEIAPNYSRISRFTLICTPFMDAQHILGTSENGRIGIVVLDIVK